MILLDINISFQIALRNIKLLCFVRIVLSLWGFHVYLKKNIIQVGISTEVSSFCVVFCLSLEHCTHIKITHAGNRL